MELGDIRLATFILRWEHGSLACLLPQLARQTRCNLVSQMFMRPICRLRGVSSEAQVLWSPSGQPEQASPLWWLGGQPVSDMTGIKPGCAAILRLMDGSGCRPLAPASLVICLGSHWYTDRLGGVAHWCS